MTPTVDVSPVDSLSDDMSMVTIGLEETALGMGIRDPVTTTALSAVAAVEAGAGPVWSWANTGVVRPALAARLTRIAATNGLIRIATGIWARRWTWCWARELIRSPGNPQGM